MNYSNVKNAFLSRKYIHDFETSNTTHYLLNFSDPRKKGLSFTNFIVISSIYYNLI